MRMDINTLAQNAIGLFIEYEDKHGYSPDTAAAAALNEITEGTGDYILVSREAHADLIAALEECLSQLQRLNSTIGWRDGEWSSVTNARDALAKARQ